MDIQSHRIILLSILFINTCLILTGCKTSYKYSFESLDGPFYSNQYIPSPGIDKEVQSIKIISFNIEFANKFEEAISLLLSDQLKDFDILLLQEMDEMATDSIAKTLKCSYIYYPSIDHPGQGKMVGNAILSKWPIISHSKIKLPHPSIYPVIKELKLYKFRKLATRAIIDIDGLSIVCYSTHGAAFNTSKSREEIADVIVKDAEMINHEHFIVGGDFNTVGYGDIKATTQPFIDKGYTWATKGIGQTIGHRRWLISFFEKKAFQADHIFIKGFNLIDYGKIENYSISDHFPIWVELESSN